MGDNDYGQRRCADGTFNERATFLVKLVVGINRKVLYPRLVVDQERFVFDMCPESGSDKSRAFYIHEIVFEKMQIGYFGDNGFGFFDCVFSVGGVVFVV